MVQRELKRTKLVAQYAEKRKSLKATIKSSETDPTVFTENLAYAVTRSARPRCVAISRDWSRRAGKRE